MSSQPQERKNRKPKCKDNRYFGRHFGGHFCYYQNASGKFTLAFRCRKPPKHPHRNLLTKAPKFDHLDVPREGSILLWKAHVANLAQELSDRKIERHRAEEEQGRAARALQTLTSEMVKDSCYTHNNHMYGPVDDGIRLNSLAAMRRETSERLARCADGLSSHPLRVQGSKGDFRLMGSKGPKEEDSHTQRGFKSPCPRCAQHISSPPSGFRPSRSPDCEKCLKEAAVDLRLVLDRLAAATDEEASLLKAINAHSKAVEQMAKVDCVTGVAEDCGSAASVCAVADSEGGGLGGTAERVSADELWPSAFDGPLRIIAQAEREEREDSDAQQLKSITDVMTETKSLELECSRLMHLSEALRLRTTEMAATTETARAEADAASQRQLDMQTDLDVVQEAVGRRRRKLQEVMRRLTGRGVADLPLPSLDD
uniref:Uncharacterized protein n=1 Tax=Chromera velia CCMP2878 TaxID=1169474 RepID=A0A0G4HSC8_9ALVE|eukprot:Cvel_8223.t1-p1 / transcript=Cvel_8223.t1 / gene=Cvel_8223 / organism=Chromera_velia_CCMP2878 / gene_product=hypothetical protein / transcript_product=hypothetical protein / location=Cvel_scaffold449:11267-13408(-) / protein_length=425 / sequence_SO=supercontig / SO=protein_coding / is_pseudo=false